MLNISATAVGWTVILVPLAALLLAYIAGADRDNS